MGQAHIGLLKYMEKLWDGDSFLIHMHSTFLEVLMDQGLIALVILYVLVYRGYRHYRAAYLAGTREAAMFAAFVYLMFIWQIDIFCYGMDIGAPLLFTFFSAFCIQGRFITPGRNTLPSA